MNNEKQKVQLLALFHYILGGIIPPLILVLSFALTPLVTIAIFKGAASSQGGAPSSVAFAWAVLVCTLWGLALSICMIITGRKLSQFKNWTFCLVIGILECSLIPFGTILGLFTVIILRRTSVVELFSESSNNVSASTKTEQINGVESHREANQSQQTQNTGQYQDMSMPTTYLWQSIAVTLLCCLPFGIPAIIYAAKTNANNDAGNMEEAYNASRKARMWCLIAFAMGLIPITIILISEWIGFLQ